MPFPISEFVRRYVRGLRRANNYPVLLPHFTLTDAGIRGLDEQVEPLKPSLARALRMCDGRQRLADVARQSGASKTEIVRLHDQGKLVLWKGMILDEQDSKKYEAARIIVSPHPDDAPLSAFSSLVGSSFNTIVVNAFSRAAWWRFSDLNAPAEQITRVRRAEEQLVARLCQFRPVMLGLPEALLRGYSMADIFAAPVPSRDADVRESIQRAMRLLAEQNPQAHWFLPLAVGDHVDHCVVRDCTISALDEAGVLAERVRFYEDLPYAAERSGAPDFSMRIEGLRLVPGESWPVGEAKLECLRVYWSQLTWSQITKVGDYAKRIGQGRPVERVWKINPR